MNPKRGIAGALLGALPVLIVAMLALACGGAGDDGAKPSPTSTSSTGVLEARTPTSTPVRPTLTPTATPTRVLAAEEATPTPTAAAAESNVWDGTYTGTVTWDCGPIGSREGTLAAEFVIVVDGTAATLEGDHTVTGSCAGTGGELTTGISVQGERTAEGFEFPGSLWGRPDPLVIEVSGNRGSGTLEGPIAGPAEILLQVEVERR